MLRHQLYRRTGQVFSVLQMDRHTQGGRNHATSLGKLPAGATVGSLARCSLACGKRRGNRAHTEHRQALSEKFRLDLSNPKAQLCMLNKLCTYQAARRAGVPTPKFWIADKRE